MRNLNIPLIVTGFTLFMCAFGAQAAPDASSYARKALSICEPGDSCVTVRSSCNSWAAVRDVYKENAEAFFKEHADQSDCAPVKDPTAIPVAVCSFMAGQCVLTAEESLVIDPRLKAY